MILEIHTTTRRVSAYKRSHVHHLWRHITTFPVHKYYVIWKDYLLQSLCLHSVEKWSVSEDSFIPGWSGWSKTDTYDYATKTLHRSEFTCIWKLGTTSVLHKSFLRLYIAHFMKQMIQQFRDSYTRNWTERSLTSLTVVDDIGVISIIMSKNWAPSLDQIRTNFLPFFKIFVNLCLWR